MPTVAAVLIESLAGQGVERVWGVVGDALNPFVDAIAAHDDIEWLTTRHEETAAFAAGAEAQLTGDLAVCAGTVGPGALHLVNGLADARASRAPVLAITGQVPTTDIGTRFHQEVDLDAVFAPVSVHAHTLRSPDQVHRALAIAVRSALSGPGPAVLTVPADLMQAEAGPPVGEAGVELGRLAPNPTVLKAAGQILDDAAAVTLLVGIGAAEAREDVLALAEHLQAPVVAALRGKSAFDWDNPYYVGLTGLIGNQAAADAIADADALVMIGTDFPYRDWLPDGAAVIQVDVDPTALGRRCPVDVPIHGDASLATQALIAHTAARSTREHLDDARSAWASTQGRRDDLAEGSGVVGTAYSAFIQVADGRLHPELVARTLGELADDDAVVTADVGLSTVWAARFLEVGERRELLGSFNHGSMANALPQAIGAQAVDRGRQVISMSGDGGLMMLLGDLRTAVVNDLPVKVVVFNNEALGLVQLEEAEAGIPPTGTELANPDLARVASALGLSSFTVSEPEALGATLEQALRTPGPVLVDVHTTAAAVSIPPDPTIRQAWGFAVSTVKDALGSR